MSGYIGSAAVLASSGAERKKTYTITGTTTSLTGLSYTVNQVHVFHNGVRLVDGTDFTATNGNSITLTNAAESGDEVVVLSYAGYQVSDTVSASQGGTFSNSIDISGTVTADGLTVDGGANISGVSNANLQITSTGGNSYQLRTDTNDAFIYQANRGKPTVKFAYGGDISFYEDTGTTAKFFWDASAESLGIGTSPATGVNLHLHEAGSGQMLMAFTNDTTGSGSNDGLHVGIDSSENSFIYNKQNTALYFGTNNSEAMRITSSGDILAKTIDARIGSDVGAVEYGTSTANSVRFYTNDTEAARFDSSGNLLVGTIDTLAYNAGARISQQSLVLTNTSATSTDYIGYFNRQSSDGTILQFGKANSNVGSISVTSSGTTYSTTSDRRLKTDIEPIVGATDKLMAMNPVSHKWKADPEADAVHGFIAQEMQEIVPEAVSGDPDGEEMMSMDYGRITPVLVAALQDAHKKIAELEARLNILEGK